MKENTQDIQTIRPYLNGTYSKEEANQLADSLKKAEADGTLDELAAEVWEEAGLQPQASLLTREGYRKEAETLLKQLQPRNNRGWKRMWQLSASIAASILLLWGGFSLKQYWDIQHMVLAQVQTGFGEKREIQLSDGSLIVLNACSKLRYPTQFVGKERKVELYGEAYFKVAPHPKKPFRVSTENFQVEVLGTVFNVKSYGADRIQSVEVESGKVQVDLPEDRIRLKKQELIYLDRHSGEYSKRKRADERVAEWRQGTLHFHQTPLADVARELERRFHCQITFRHGETLEHLITGEHDCQSLESILESLKYVCGIQYEKLNDTIVLFE